MLVVLVIFTVSLMTVIVSSQYDVIETFTSIANERRESSQEDVEFNIDRNHDVYIKNKSPTPVKVVEMRILDNDGNLVSTCPTDITFSGGEREDIAVYDDVLGEVRLNPSWHGFVQACAASFDEN